MSDDIVWNIYEEKKVLSGKKLVIEFMKKTGEYFKSVTTKFETFGILEDNDKIAIYGSAEFIRGSKTVNTFIHVMCIYSIHLDKLKKSTHTVIQQSPKLIFNP